MSTSNPPKQHEVALAKATYIRIARAAFRAELRGLDYAEARGLVAGVLCDTPDWLEGQRIFELLNWVPRLSAPVIREALEVRRIGEQRTVESLTWRQACDLAEALRMPGKLQ